MKHEDSDREGNELIETKNKQILIDGEPQLIMCGEIHYYRLSPEEWQDRLDKLKSAGCNAVASYVPWLCHEPQEGAIELHGQTRPELDLAGFIDLCEKNDLYFFVRPGPFIMAEMKNEGIPHWVMDKHPDIVPVTWDGRQVLAKTLDYLAPGFLAETRKWFEAVMEVIAPRLYPNGGNIIGVQLDNEIGMLSWVSNSPDLTDVVLEDFTRWLKEQYDVGQLEQRYPFDLDNETVRSGAIRSPKENYAPSLHLDLGYYMRNRFARYVATLRGYAEEFGVKDVPFVVNIHGTGGGRALTYPIGISQLYESYTQAPGYISGSDIYFGDLTMGTFQDLYLINGFMDAVHNPDQPLTSVEFNCGDGNFGETHSGRYDPSAADFKIRMCIAQGNRMINYYLFTGGRNYRLDETFDDGNDRIAHTGERHGFAAPVSPEGELNYTFPRMARATRTMMAVADKLAVMEEEHDNVSFAFIPDYFMTESRYPESEQMREMYQNIEANRAPAAWENLARAMLLAGYRFGSVDIQNKPLDPKATPVLVLASALYLDRTVQQKLVDYMNVGGRIMLYGQVPNYDLEAKPCTILAEALGVKHKAVRSGDAHFALSVYGVGRAESRPEIRTHMAQEFDIQGAIEPFLRVYGSDEVCGFHTQVGDGEATVIATVYNCQIEFYKEMLESLGTKAALQHDCKFHGIFMTSTANKEGERFIHLLNLDGFDKTFSIYENGNELFNGRSIELQSKDGVMLPINMTIGDVKINYSTAEIQKSSGSTIEFRLTQSEDVISVTTDRDIDESDDYLIEQRRDQTLITSRKHAKVDDKLIISFR
ncbi:beta-galactosidase [Pseudalkalibacillus sp. Hm43]|uniref:beta-galactosidase n=1 Tax=Pseudalkalibacillus sp. Hm43 TaxID=3450742 RepID=UPI003F425F7F